MKRRLVDTSWDRRGVKATPIHCGSDGYVHSFPEYITEARQAAGDVPSAIQIVNYFDNLHNASPLFPDSDLVGPGTR